MSLKNTVRKTIAGVMIAAVATSYFAGLRKDRSVRQRSVHFRHLFSRDSREQHEPGHRR